MTPRVAVVGAGPMGVSTVRALLRPPRAVSGVLLVDRDPQLLDAVTASLTAEGLDGVHPWVGDAAEDATSSALTACAVIAAALAWTDSRPLLDIAINHPVRLATIGRPPEDWRRRLPPLHPGARVVVGGGLEPGLTEVLAADLARQVGEGGHLRLYCGGVPVAPREPLRHLAWFGTRLTIAMRPTYQMRAGALRAVPRFGGLELVEVPGVGVLEAYDDGLAPWLTEDPDLTRFDVDQKTLRWPGYAAKVRLLAELGLLSEGPVQTPDGPVRPHLLLDELLRPHITPTEDDRDVTVLAVEARSSDGARQAGVVLRAGTDPATGETGMGRLTGGALAALVLALAGDATLRSGVLHPAEIHRGTVPELLQGLRRLGVSVLHDHDVGVRPLERRHLISDDAEQ